MIAMGAQKCAGMGPSVQGCIGVGSAFVCNAVKFYKSIIQIYTLWNLAFKISYDNNCCQ